MGSFFRQPLLWVIVSVITLGFVIGCMLVLLRPKPPLPANIYANLKSPLIVPTEDSQYKIDQTTVTFNAAVGVVFFHAIKGNQDLLFSEQATPDPFNDLPEYYTKVTEKLHAYQTFDTVNGKASLTHPDELKGGQSAIINGKGTLMFIKPNHDLSDGQWRMFLNELTVAKQ